jgi:uncharacterized protein YbjT (DUF2867 family)
MSPIQNVALIGVSPPPPLPPHPPNTPQASGNLGPTILTALLSANFTVTVLTRPTSTTVFPPTVKVLKVDYTSPTSLQSAFTGIDAVVSTIAAPALDTQLLLIDAAIAAGVTRFLPSEFGSDLGNPKGHVLPVFAGKVKTEEYLKTKAAANPGFSYTLVRNGAFLDWGLQVGFIFDLASATPKIWNGGDKLFSTTSLATVGRAVAAVLKKPEETKNRAVLVQDLALSQNQILEIANKVDPETKREPLRLSTEDVLKTCYERLGQGKFDEETFVPMIFSAIWGEGYGGHFVENDDAVLGIEQRDLGYVEELVKAVLKK